MDFTLSSFLHQLQNAELLTCHREVCVQWRQVWCVDIVHFQETKFAMTITMMLWRWDDISVCKSSPLQQILWFQLQYNRHNNFHLLLQELHWLIEDSTQWRGCRRNIFADGIRLLLNTSSYIIIINHHPQSPSIIIIFVYFVKLVDPVFDGGVKRHIKQLDYLFLLTLPLCTWHHPLGGLHPLYMVHILNIDTFVMATLLKES